MHFGPTVGTSGEAAQKDPGKLLTSTAENSSHVQFPAVDGRTENREIPCHRDRILVGSGSLQRQ